MRVPRYPGQAAIFNFWWHAWHRCAFRDGVVPAKAGIHNHQRPSSCKVMPNHERCAHLLRLHPRQWPARNALGVTNTLRIRLEQHRNGRGSEFVKKYGIYRLVRVEEFASPRDGVAREKQLKNWHRDWKIRLIEEDNPDWSDLSHLL